MFKKILIANRGEIAVRVIRACREMGIETVAVYSLADQECLHAQLADEAVCIGSAPAKDSYLKMERILSATLASGAEAIHPGFGFLSENSKFAELCEKCNIAFIGPDADIIEHMGNKSEARNTMIAAGVPVVPGTVEPVYDITTAMAAAEEIGYPVMIKASAGGGGKGMRIANCKEEFASLFDTAQCEAKNGFSDDAMYIEKYIPNARHIEFQILADNYGNVVHLGERDCSIQRRHQKMIEESPSAAISEELREEMGKVAVRAAKAAGYKNAGTIEFILDHNQNFYFIEMNTRIQVEHGVTEMVTGIDLIKEQIYIAAGERLGYQQKDIQIHGHAIECRINAEDPTHNFRPSPGKVTTVHFPGGFGVRIDTMLYQGYTIPPNYDSLVAKIIVHAKDRKEAIRKMRGAIGEVIIDGIDTNIDFLYDLINEEDYQNGEYTTDFVEQVLNRK